MTERDRTDGPGYRVDRSTDISRPLDELHEKERIKAESRALRGTVETSLADPITGALYDGDPEVVKFHGIYQQDDRDQRDERRRRKLEPAYRFMIRIRLPGGICRPEQWLALDALATSRANGTLRLTTRQTFQLHGVLKRDLRATLQGIHETLLDTIGACGDVNRGVMASPLPELDAIHAQLLPIAAEVSRSLLPRTRAYHEIWLDGQPVHRTPDTDEAGEDDPLYGRTYLPRKFKIGFAVPPANDVDVFTQDLGFIAIREGERLAGFNVVVGGGMGRSENDPRTYPRLGDLIGFCPPGDAVDVARTVVGIQRDFGNRVDRRLARLKYTIDRHGLAWFSDELRRRRGHPLDEAREFHFDTRQDRLEWSRNADGSWNYTIFIENGRVKDEGRHRTLTGLRELASVHAGEFRITPNQNLVVAGIPDAAKDVVTDILERHGILEGAEASPVRRHSMACVAFPTCPLAMAESERYFPHLLTRIEPLLAEAGLAEVPIVMRMSGCANGCSRPYVAEVSFSGRAPGRYDVHLGGGFEGRRLARPYLENVDEETILAHLGECFRRFAGERREGEHFGDFVVRAGLVSGSGAEANSAFPATG